MAKYVICTNWEWPNGVKNSAEMQDMHLEIKSKNVGFENIMVEVGENTHQSIICSFLKNLQRIS